jgi:amidase
VTDDFAWLDAIAQQQLIDAREVSARELTEAALGRIEALNPQLNAVIHSAADDVLEKPGVPFLVKDVLATEAGRPYHCGLRAARDARHIAREDSWLVTRYRQAGLASLGRTNAPELASSVTTEPLAYGPTRNPWDPSRSPGGSSGGAAAAVASGMVPAAHGNDMGGSIRIPAANCGLVGLKPSRGRTSLGPEFGEFWGPLTHQHVLTRSVRDSAWILDATAGPAPGDPYSAPPSPNGSPWLTAMASDPGALRIGVRTRLPGGGPPHLEIRTAVCDAAALLERLGHAVTAADLPALDEPGLAEHTPIVFGAVVARDAERWSRVLGRDVTDELEPMNALLAALGRDALATQWLEAIETLQAWARRMADQWKRHELLLLPVTPEPPMLLGAIAPDAKDPLELLADLTRMTTFTAPFNITGEPAVSLPLHWTSDGLPIGVQLVAPMGREDRLFQIAHQLEVARPWAERRAQIVAG